MSGVRNLRAMFEQKGDSLPDDRGRSPGPGGFASPSPSASPRPLSKVRTAFVAIEKDGRIGLKREPSRDSETVSSRRFSNDTDASTPQPLSEKSDVFSDNMASTVASFKTNLTHEAIPESPRQDTPVKFSPKKELKPSLLEPNANPDKVTDEEEPKTKMLASNPTESSATRLGGTILNGGISDALNSTPSTTAKAKAPGASKPAPKTVAPVSTAKTATRAPRSPLPSKAPDGKEPSKAAVSSTNSKKVATTKPAASKPAASKPVALDLPSSGTGFVKPKPKSPTRPVKLPSSLTTHTASSAQKTGAGNAAPAPRRSLSRASGNAQHLSVNPTLHRSPSHNSISTVGTTTAKTLKHKPSSLNVGRSRPSLGLPPKPAVKEQPAPKKEAQVDEGFLARMMRPTASSAKKTSDKAPVTPPRKQNAPTKKPDTKEAEKPAKKTVAKTPTPSTPVKTVKKTVKEQPTAKEIAPAVAQAETAEATIEKAKQSTDTAEAPVVNKKVEAEAETAAKDDATTVAQEETVDGDTETVATSANIAATPEIPPSDELEAAEVQPVSEPTTSAEVEETEAVTSVPAVSEDPLKVEDIEDAIQEAQEPSHQLQSTESAVEVSQEDIPEAKDLVSAEEPVVEVAQTVDEPLKPEETVEEAKTEAPITFDPHDTADHIDEVAIKDAAAAAL
ncbi:hypothetical protein FHL15_004196 [Xylaria flabelliformis]|uniref:Uncharacterized protein n=1 Tax=Xylaria flabelliformis TaxID=2512241 RepID=A0A553I4J9_9PEZI|nr:hypothetical protein FHL15_004196 [Xylaria flabelliformis]